MSGDTKKSCPAKGSEDAILWAAENGLRVVFPQENQLLVDIDSPADRNIFDQNRDVVEEAYGIADESSAPSRSGGRKEHIIVTLERAITPLERIALQAVLGSDRRREAHSLRRLLAGEERPTLFFEKSK